MKSNAKVTDLAKYEDNIAGIRYALELAADKTREAISLTEGGNPALSMVLTQIERAMEEYRHATSTPSVRNALKAAKLAA